MGGFKARDGLSFERAADGGVRVDLGPDEGDFLVDADTWASAVAHVSGAADHGAARAAAELLHAGVPLGQEVAAGLRAPVAGKPGEWAEGVQPCETLEDARTLSGIVNGRRDGTEARPVRRVVSAWVPAD
jgi:hypothetical protein